MWLDEMIVPTDDIHEFLLSQGLSREGIPFVFVGYRDGGLEIIVIDEEHSFIDTDFLLKDLGNRGYYETAAALQAWVIKKQSAK